MRNPTTIAELEAFRNELINKAKKVGETIRLLRSRQKKEKENKEQQHDGARVIKIDGYNPKASMKEKLVYVLEKENRFIRTRQIAAYLHRMEPRISEDEFMNKIYPPLALLKRSGAVVNRTIGKNNANTFWGNKQWVDAKGNIRKDFMYDKEQLEFFGNEKKEARK
jgi:hypothetical protein